MSFKDFNDEGPGTVEWDIVPGHIGEIDVHGNCRDCGGTDRLEYEGHGIRGLTAGIIKRISDGKQIFKPGDIEQM